MVTFLKYLPLLFFITFDVFPQEEKLHQKESELYKIKDEIKSLEVELSSKTTAEKKSFEVVENLNKQNFLINKILGNLRIEINGKQKEINNVEKRISGIESDINRLKENYAKYVVAIYKKGPYNELESLVNSSSLQQAIMRSYYLQVFSEQRSKDLIKLREKIKELADVKVILEEEKAVKNKLVSSKEEERKSLSVKLNEKKRVLTSIKKNKSELKKLLTAKKQAQDKIENLIAKLVEESERKKRESELNKKEQLASEENSINEKSKIKDESSGYEFDLSTDKFSSFINLKGKMNWPLQKGKVIRKFGENKNKSLNTVTLNYGIDIEAGKDKNVRSVAEGVIAAIDWLPGYGNVVIVSHKDGYRSVYSHLAEIFVAEGDKVNAGTALALVAEGLDGEVLHFEIWKSREKQNPELWLAKR